MSSDITVGKQFNTNTIKTGKSSDIAVCKQFNTNTIQNREELRYYGR
jgi:hypothetical protein